MTQHIHSPFSVSSGLSCPVQWGWGNTAPDRCAVFLPTAIYVPLCVCYTRHLFLFFMPRTSLGPPTEGWWGSDPAALPGLASLLIGVHFVSPAARNAAVMLPSHTHFLGTLQPSSNSCSDFEGFGGVACFHLLPWGINQCSTQIMTTFTFLPVWVPVEITFTFFSFLHQVSFVLTGLENLTRCSSFRRSGCDLKGPHFTASCWKSGDNMRYCATGDCNGQQIETLPLGRLWDGLKSDKQIWNSSETVFLNFPY